MFHLRTYIYPSALLWLIAILFVPSMSGHSQGSNQPNLQAIDAFLQNQVSANRIPGLAVAVVQGNEIIFIKGYGEAAPGVPVTPQTQFYIGSVTKSFTALAIMQLVQEGRLELDAPVVKYLPWFQVADSEASSKITIRHLLNHTSGLRDGRSQRIRLHIQPGRAGSLAGGCPADRASRQQVPVLQPELSVARPTDRTG